METTTLLWTPGHVTQANHVEMLRVQSLVARRLRLQCSGLSLVHALVCDRIDEPFRQEVAAIAAEFDEFFPFVPDGYGEQWGVVRPTRFAIDVALSHGCSHIIRIIQDTYISNAAAFVHSLAPLLLRDEPWLAANLHYWRSDGHKGLCQDMGVPFHSVLQYPNGAVMCAPAKTWQHYYSQLPPSVNHYWDDVMMGEKMLTEGVPLIDIPASWQHLHDAPESLSRDVYLWHQSEFDSAPLHHWSSIERR